MANYHSYCFSSRYGMQQYSNALRGKDAANRQHDDEFHSVDLRTPCTCALCGKEIKFFGISTQTQAQIDAAPAPSIHLNVRVTGEKAS